MHKKTTTIITLRPEDITAMIEEKHPGFSVSYGRKSLTSLPDIKLRKVECEPAEDPKSDDDGWIEWKGSDTCHPPYTLDTIVTIRRRDGSVSHPSSISSFRWNHTNMREAHMRNSDIVAYRIVD